jgi:hypothetical protein
MALAMPTLFDKLKSVLAPYVRPFGVVDDAPPVAANGEDSPLRIHGTTRAVYVHPVGVSGTATDAALGMWVTRAVVDVGVEGGGGRTRLPDFACSQVRVIAHASNTQPIYIGDVTVASTNVCPTTAKNGEQIDRMSNANEVYVVAAAGHTGQKLYLQTR